MGGWSEGAPPPVNLQIEYIITDTLGDSEAIISRSIWDKSESAFIERMSLVPGSPLP